MKRTIALAALAVMPGMLLYSVWSAGSAAVAPIQVDVPAPPSPGRELTLNAADGTRIAASYWPGITPRAPAVLLLHGNGGSRRTMAANAAFLAEAGYAVMAIDFRGHGESAPEARSFGLFESRDALAAFRWLKQAQGSAPVAVVGISLGGAASLLGEAGPLPADALVLQAVYPDIRHAIRSRIAGQTGTAAAWLLEPLLSLQALPRFGVWPDRLSPIRAVRASHGPVLVLGGGADSYTPPDESRALADAAGGRRWLWIVPGEDHRGMSILKSPTYRRLLLEFLGNTIGHPAAR